MKNIFTGLGVVITTLFIVVTIPIWIIPWGLWKIGKSFREYDPYDYWPY